MKQQQQHLRLFLQFGGKIKDSSKQIQETSATSLHLRYLRFTQDLVQSDSD